MKNTVVKLMGVLAVVLWSVLYSTAYAQIKVSPAEEKNLRTTLEGVFEKGLNIQSITKTPMGFYEIFADGRIFYTDSKVTYIFNGDLIQIANAENITQNRLAVLSAVDLKSLPLAQALKYVKGSGGPQVAIIEDPNCIYCQKLHRELVSKIDNITVYVFLVPILSADSMTKTQNILCSSEPLKVWKAWMFDKTVPTSVGQCPPKATEQINAGITLAKTLGVKGTPTVIFQNGRRIGGMPSSLEQFKEMLLAK